MILLDAAYCSIITRSDRSTLRKTEKFSVSFLLEPGYNSRLTILKYKHLGGRLPVHLGMNCFPGVCLTKESFVKLKVNFSGPFKFDLNSIPDYRSDSTSYFDLLPNEVMQLLLQYVAKTPAFPQMQLVSSKK